MDTFDNTIHPENNEPVEAPSMPQSPAAPEPPAEAAPQYQEPRYEEPRYAPQPQYDPQSQYDPQPTYRGAGTGRKGSPYADSPYVTYRQAQHSVPPYEGRYQTPYEAPKKKPRVKKERGPLGKKLGAALLALVLLVGSNAVTAALVGSRWGKELDQTEKQFDQRIQALQKQIDAASNANSALAGGSVAPGEALTPAQVYAQNVDSVVAISATVQSTNIYGQPTQGGSTGSGFVLTQDGYVVTNCHVVEGAASVSIITSDGSEYPAQVVGYDDNNDVAVLKTEAEGLQPVTLGSSSSLIIGDMVVAIGNPLGELTSTQTVGYVSGMGREVATDTLTTISMIQTDAAINPGNSGGPLFNMAGEVIGITTAKYSGTTNSGASIEGIGFAIPIDDVLGMIDDLVEYGYVTGAYLGINVQNVDESAASMYNLPSGAYVYSVVEGGSADRAGVKPKDIIIDLGGYSVTNVTTLTRALRNFKAGDITTITVIRGGVQQELSITLDEKPREMPTVTQPQQDPTMPSEGNYDDWYEFFRRFFG